MKIANSRSARSEDGRRARIILDLGRGLSLRAISAGERCSVNTVRLWRERFREDRLAGLYSRHRGRQPTPGREKLEARIIDWTLHRKPSGGATQWSTRGLARELGTTGDACLAGLAQGWSSTPSPPAIYGQQRS